MQLRRLLSTASTFPGMNYAAAASKGVQFQPQQSPSQSTQFARTASATTRSDADETRPKRRSPSPSHIPRTSGAESNVYVLTLLTDKAHRERITQIRNRYFPKHLNKLQAHLTLFHALPGSRLESHILPQIEALVLGTSPFTVKASRPFRLKRGMAISVPTDAGGAQGKAIHHTLQQAWRCEGFLSDQDAGGCQLHYTVMNKVDDEVEVAKAFNSLSEEFDVDVGTVEGLALWRYDRGFWRWEKGFRFGQVDG